MWHRASARWRSCHLGAWLSLACHSARGSLPLPPTLGRLCSEAESLTPRTPPVQRQQCPKAPILNHQVSSTKKSKGNEKEQEGKEPQGKKRSQLHTGQAVCVPTGTRNHTGGSQGLEHCPRLEADRGVAVMFLRAPPPFRNLCCCDDRIGAWGMRGKGGVHRHKTGMDWSPEPGDGHTGAHHTCFPLVHGFKVSIKKAKTDRREEKPLNYPLSGVLSNGSCEASVPFSRGEQTAWKRRFQNTLAHWDTPFLHRLWGA